MILLDGVASRTVSPFEVVNAQHHGRPPSALPESGFADGSRGRHQPQNFRRVRRRFLSPLPSGTMDEDHRTFLVSRCVLIVHAYYSHLAFSTHLGNADSSFIGWTSCSTAFLRNSFFLPSPVLGLVIGLHEVFERRNVRCTRGVLAFPLTFAISRES